MAKSKSRQKTSQFTMEDDNLFRSAASDLKNRVNLAAACQTLQRLYDQFQTITDHFVNIGVKLAHGYKLNNQPEQSLRIFEELWARISPGKANLKQYLELFGCEICYNIGTFYMSQNQLTKALEYLFKADNLAKNPDPYIKSTIAVVYRNLADQPGTKVKKSKLHKLAEPYMIDAEKLFRKKEGNLTEVERRARIANIVCYVGDFLEQRPANYIASAGQLLQPFIFVEDPLISLLFIDFDREIGEHKRARNLLIKKINEDPIVTSDDRLLSMFIIKAIEVFNDLGEFNQSREYIGRLAQVPGQEEAVKSQYQILAFAQGDHSLSIHHFQTKTGDKRNGYLIVAAKSHFVLRQYSQALTLIEQSLPNIYLPRNLRIALVIGFEAAIKLNDFDHAQRYLSELETISAKMVNLESYEKLIAVAVNQQKHEELPRLIDTAITKYGAISGSTVLTICNLYMSLKHFDQLKELISKTESKLTFSDEGEEIVVKENLGNIKRIIPKTAEEKAAEELEIVKQRTIAYCRKLEEREDQDDSDLVLAQTNPQRDDEIPAWNDHNLTHIPVGNDKGGIKHYVWIPPSIRERLVDDRSFERAIANGIVGPRGEQGVVICQGGKYCKVKILGADGYIRLIGTKIVLNNPSTESKGAEPDQRAADTKFVFVILSMVRHNGQGKVNEGRWSQLIRGGQAAAAAAAAATPSERTP